MSGFRRYLAARNCAQQPFDDDSFVTLQPFLDDALVLDQGARDDPAPFDGVFAGNEEDGLQLIHYDVLTDRLLRIEHNLFVDNAMVGIGMMDGAETEEDFRAASIPEPIYIFNNTFVNNDYGITGGDSTVVVNNLFVGHDTNAVTNVDGNSALAFNLFFDNGTDNSGSNVDADSTVLADPLLDADLRPLPGSPAIDAGTASYDWQGMTVLDLAAGDYNGNAPDLGATESP